MDFSVTDSSSYTKRTVQEDARTKLAKLPITYYPHRNMAEPAPLVRVLIILMTCFLLFHRSSPAAIAPIAPAGILCIPRERDALRDFKAGLNDSGNILSSWRGADCCRWKGVGCSNRTGHVAALRINSLDGNSYPLGTIGGEIRSSLLSLRHLKQLDLSYNDFSGQPIPEFIGALQSLTHLDLSYSNFGGRIPPHIGNLSNLLSLHLNSYPYNPPEIQVVPHSHDLAWVSGLRKLQVLSMSGVDLSAAVDWFQAVNMLPGLIHLDLSKCGLQNTITSPLHSNLTSLESLDLHYNPFNTSLVAKKLVWLWDLPSLQVLSLGVCGIHGPIPDVVGNLTSLQNLELGFNHLTGVVPLTFKKLKKLQWLELSDNFINMDITKLLHLLPSNELQMLDLSHNSLTGSLPDWIGRFSSLNLLYLGYNKLAGEIPVGIRELRNLTVLSLSSNSLHGTVTEDHFTNLTTLQCLWISHNSLTVKVSSTWYAPFRLISAGFSSCILGPQFPAWLIQPTMEALDISNTSIHDNIPAEFWTGSSLWFLHMSRNRLVGMLPTLGDLELVALDISSNELTGPIPTLPKTLSYMDLSKNNLSGPLPSDTEGLMLKALFLFNNSLSGTIPCSLLQLQQLNFLDLSNNLLNGTFPKCPRGYRTSSITTLNLNSNNLSGAFPMFLQRCRDLTFLDLAYNSFSGSLPAWIGSKLSELALLRLRSNMFSGGIPGQLSWMKGL
ncbi:hypothetical protein ACQ4PT_062735 [Festuca glaucescens]